MMLLSTAVRGCSCVNEASEEHCYLVRSCNRDPKVALQKHAESHVHPLYNCSTAKMTCFTAYIIFCLVCARQSYIVEVLLCMLGSRHTIRPV